MTNIYRVVGNAANGVWQVASELARTKGGKESSKQSSAISAATLRRDTVLAPLLRASPTASLTQNFDLFGGYTALLPVGNTISHNFEAGLHVTF